MNISDYFIGKTKPIEYPRFHYKSVTVDGEYIVLQPYGLSDACPPDASEEIRKQAFIDEIRHHGPHSLSDNRMLCKVLSTIKDSFETGRLEYASPIMQDLYTTVKGKIKIDEHLNHLAILYLLFLCYREIVWDERCIDDSQIRYMRNQIAYKQPPIKCNDTRSTLCWQYIHFILFKFHDNTIEIKLRMHPPELYEVQSASCLYYALIHQLLLHISAGKKGLDGYCLAECQSCHQPFPKKHGNTKFCPTCGRNSERVRDYKRREKEKQHAQETHP